MKRPINRREFAASSLGGALLPTAVSAQTTPAAAAPAKQAVGPPKLPARAVQVYPGVWKLTLGTPETFTPVKLHRRKPAEAGPKQLASASQCPLPVSAVRGRSMKRGFVVTLPLEAGEVVYGLGLQLMSLIQRGTKKTLRVNADPKNDAGDSHAPVPFYVSTRGYGVLIDTARYAAFYLGGRTRRGESAVPREEGSATSTTAQNLPQAYFRRRFGDKSEVIVDVPHSGGLDIYIFAGPSMREAVQRYNLFSGGGCLPSLAGLGVMYRTEKSSTQDQVVAIASDIRDSDIPCDVHRPGARVADACLLVHVRLEQQVSRSGAVVAQLRTWGSYRVNLWEHAFTHPIRRSTRRSMPHSGDYEVWGGLVPDFRCPKRARSSRIIHEKEHVAPGASGLQARRVRQLRLHRQLVVPRACGQFPSGLDGEQMHSLFGLRYQQTLRGRLREAQAADLRPGAVVRELWPRRIPSCSTAISTTTRSSSAAW